MRSARVLAAFVAALALAATAACSTTGSTTRTCDTTEVSPSSQPGAAEPDEALEWFLEHGGSDFGPGGFSESGSSETRVVYSDGLNQIAVGALPAGPDDEPVWVVLMTYECH